jgi:pimeloyl-ACP methyl ester carboxylesterase
VPVGLPFYAPGVADRMQAQVDRHELEAALETFFREVVGMNEAELATFRQLPMWQGRVQLTPTIPRELTFDRTYRYEPARYAGLRMPTLLLQGGESPPLFRQAVEALDAALPDSRIVILPDQRHVAMDTNPELFASAVLGFLLQ